MITWSSRSLNIVFSLKSLKIQESTHTTEHKSPNKANLFISLLLKYFHKITYSIVVWLKIKFKRLVVQTNSKRWSQSSHGNHYTPTKPGISCSLKLLCIQQEETLSAELSSAGFQQPSKPASKSCWWENSWLLLPHDSKFSTNQVTISIQEPIDTSSGKMSLDCIDDIGPATYISKLDMLKGYWHACKQSTVWCAKLQSIPLWGHRALQSLGWPPCYFQEVVPTLLCLPVSPLSPLQRGVKQFDGVNLMGQSSF